MRVVKFLGVFILLSSCSMNNDNGLSSVELDRTWELVDFINENGEELTLYDYEVHTLRFEEDETELSGEAACNYYGGKYRAYKNGTISIHDLAVTEALCRQPSLGDEFVNALLEVSKFRQTGGELTLTFGTKGKLKFYERLE